MKSKLFLSLLSLVLVFSGCQTDAKESQTKKEPVAQKAERKTKPKVTFVELGSVNCIPCKAMQPVMEAIEKEFGDQIEVVFYDVWQDNAPAKKYEIKLIPTQVFLDENGQEFFRHEGFYAQEEIEKLLTGKGLKKKS